MAQSEGISIDASVLENARRAKPESQAVLLQKLAEQFGSTLRAAPDLAWKEFGQSFACPKSDLLTVMSALKSKPDFAFDMLVDITCIDWLDSRPNRYEVIYHLLSLSHLHRLCLRVELSENDAKVDSVRSLWHAANFLEREAWDMYGVEFVGHGDLRRILMYDEFIGHPLRKDYPVQGKQPRVKLRLPELKNTSAYMRREQLVTLPSKGGKTV